MWHIALWCHTSLLLSLGRPKGTRKLGGKSVFQPLCGCCWMFANGLQAELSPQGLGGIRCDHGQLCADICDSSPFNLSTIPAWEKELSKTLYIYRKGQEQFIETTSAGKSLCSGLGVTSTSPGCGGWPAPWHQPAAILPQQRLPFPCCQQIPPPEAQPGSPGQKATEGTFQAVIWDVPASLHCPPQLQLWSCPVHLHPCPALGADPSSPGSAAEHEPVVWPCFPDRKLAGNSSSPSFPEMVVQVKPEQQGVKDPRISTNN